MPKHRNGKDTNISVRISLEDKAALDKFCAQERRSLADAIRIILQDRLIADKCYPPKQTRK
jgi:hypothetical protein